jgi:pSer/pThr/pTyr-binding forkhead associated (FHA) protein
LLWVFVIIVAVKLKSQIVFKSKKNLSSSRSGRSDGKYFLQVVEGPMSGISVPLENKDITVGRADDNSIVLSDDFVSAKHLKVWQDGRRIYLEDLSSTNGTFIDNKRVYGVSQIKLGQMFSMGVNGLEVNVEK